MIVEIAIQVLVARHVEEVTPISSADSPRFVGLDLVVTDSHGAAISGLSASDFRVLDDKKRQATELCRSNGHVVTHRLASLQDEISSQSGSRLPAPTVILLDLMNARFMTAASGWAETEAAIESLESPERVSLYLLTIHGELSPIQSIFRANADVALGRTSWTKTVRSVLDAVAKSQRKLRPQAIRDPGYRFEITLDAGADTQRIRCLVMDRNMNVVGSLTIPIGPAHPDPTPSSSVRH